MNATDTTTGQVLSAKELVKRFHSHADAHLSTQATQFKTGVLDVELLTDAGLHLPEALLECAVVGVKYAATTYSNASHKKEAVFEVRDSFGVLLGHYFANAFRALMR